MLELRPSDAVNLAGHDTGREYLSHSRIGILLACQRKYQLHYEARLERVDRGEAREMGAAFQKGIEANDPITGFDEIMAGAAELTGGSDDYDKLRVKAHTVLAAATLYLQLWPAPDNETRELEYLVRLRNPWTGRYSNTFDLKGYADGVEDHGAHLELTENKLVGQISAVGVRKLVLDRQVTLGAYGLWRATGKAVREVRYRYLRKPSIKQKQGETVDEYIERMSADYATRPEFYAQEEVLFRTDEDMLRVEAELWTWAEQIRQMRRQKIATRNTGACGDYGGCDFLPICCNEPDHKGLFRVRPIEIEKEIAHAPAN